MKPVFAILSISLVSNHFALRWRCLVWVDHVLR